MPKGALKLATLLALSASCGPDGRPSDRCRQQPTFLLTIDIEDGAFPDDTRVSFEYGGGTETFELGSEHTPQVVFCEAGPAVDGAGGAASVAEPVTEIVCELWTGGSTDVAITAQGFEAVTGFELRTDRELCTVTERITLTAEVD